MSLTAPRIVIGAPASGGGKTTFTCGLLQALVRRGMAPAACKCGPDYIDPMFHSEVIGAFSRNLDLFFSDAAQVRSLVADSAAHSDVVVIEGVMGYYDGIAVSDEASAWDVARTTDAPAVLVIDGRGRARSIAAEVAGFARFRADSHVEGVVLNRVSDMLYPRLKDIIETETGVRVYGYLPVLEDCSLESRHLGLVTASEVADLQVKLDKLASAMERTVDIDGLLHLASSAPALNEAPWLELIPGFRSSGYNAPRIAVAHDDAFCFYYADALRLLQHLGAELVEFSPLADTGLPEGVSGLYLGGGYPELHARELNANALMRTSISRAIRSGMPTIAECGGFMYLHDVLEDSDGGTYSEVGVVPGASFKTSKLGRFGYITLTAAHDGLLVDADEKLRAHEFHYWDSETPGNDFTAEKPQSGRSWKCGMSTPSMYAGYPHLYLPAHPQAARRFVDACAAYDGERGQR
ncbi:MAG: cobyrinate a,c-diamide synthase [Eggerthellaceae bacterium]|nr:cobyrinate a,c-diamide synthase [Eggerthellaceae bacterium]